jgi:hypothetical protein
MIGEEDFLFRPVSRRYYTADKLIDGSIDLEFVALCNEALDIEDENTRRAHAAAKEG